MSDEGLLLLEREGKNAPVGSVERYRWRRELVRFGRQREAGFEVGDHVREIEPVWGAGSGRKGRQGTVRSLTKSTIKVQLNISEKLCVRPKYRRPATRKLILVKVADPW